MISYSKKNHIVFMLLCSKGPFFFFCLGSSDPNATPFKGLNHLFFSLFFLLFFFLPPALLDTVTQFLEKLSDQLSERYVFSLRYFCKQACISRAEGFMYYKISRCCLCFDEIKSKTVSRVLR